MTNSESKPLVRWHFDQDKASLALIEPWCVAGAMTLHRWLRRRCNIAGDALTGGLDCVSIERLSSGLLSDLHDMLRKTVQLEVQIGCLRGDIVDDQGQDPLRQFLDMLKTPDRQRCFWTEYSVLEQRLKQTIKSWVRSTAEMLSHLQSDFVELCSTFDIDSDDQLECLETAAGDRHHHGRRVQIVRFTSGRRLVYKPRNIDAESTFYYVTDWLNQAGFALPMRRPVTCAKATHGWVEFIEGRRCDDDASLQRLHRRQGALLAVLHLLDATDITIENLIVSGEQPVVIDAEAICSPFYTATSGASCPEDHHALSASVMRIGMLPHRSWKSASGIDVDVSAMAGTEASDYSEFVISGFEEASNLILKRKHDWTRPGGIIDQLCRLRTRLIARPTRAYGMLLREFTHPDVMRDPDARHELMKILSAKHGSNAVSNRFIQSEMTALCRDDIPVFEIDAESGWVHSCSESSIVQLQPSPIDSLRSRLNDWSSNTIDRECQTIRMALESDVCRPERSARRDVQPPSAGTNDPIDLLTSTAIDIADRLCSRRYDNDWLDLTLGSDRKRWHLSNLDTDLYSGRCGISLALATIARQSGVNRFADIAQATMQPLRDAATSNGVERVGAFSGIAGQIYTAVHLACLLEDSSWLDLANQWLVGLPGRIAFDDDLDLIAGSAGCLTVLSTVGQYLAPKLVEDSKSSCVQRLVNGAVKKGPGVCWPLASFEHQGMTGMAHGNAGIAMALATQATSNSSVETVAEQAIEFEQAHYDAGINQWKDLRRGSAEIMTAWCHGAPGVGMGRLRMLSVTDAPGLAVQVRQAVLATQQAGFGNSHCLCHGDLGNLDFLTMVSRIRPDIVDPTYVLERASRVAQSIRVNGPRCGTPSNIETPGLMTGLAGIAWGLLRASAPREIPSVLTLDAPRIGNAILHSSKPTRIKKVNY